MLLSRTLRHAASAGRAASNAWSGGPLGPGLGLPYELRLVIRAEPDPGTGYICDIKRMDDCLLQAVRLNGHAARDWFEWLERLNGHVLALLPIGQAESLALQLSPQLALTYQFTEHPAMHYCEQFEFSAAHRLHVEHLSEAENQRLFGKCNNPNGHGHNYVLDVSIEVPTTESSQGQRLGLVDRMADVVRTQIVNRFDHRHLNLDVPEFKSLNPTVENIAAVIWERLAAVDALGTELVAVRLYETAKTWAERRRGDS